MKECGLSYPLVWIDARLHNVKTKLKAALQSILDEASGYDTILFATGFCGNSIAGLSSREASLVIPRVDDCTSLLLGSARKKSRYGKERADHIFSVMFAHYRRIALLDTGCYPIEPSLEKAKAIAAAFSLDCQVLPAGISYFKELLTGPWEKSRFLTVPPFTAVTQDMLQILD